MADPIGQVSSQTNALSPWAAPYVTDMLSKGQALASMPYQGYTGPISAGASGLQQQAFTGLGALTVPTASTAGSFTGTGYQPLTAEEIAAGATPSYATPTNVVQQYMNPYLENALNPQYEAARRQSQIEQQNLQSRYGKAGAYGGGRQAIAEAELQRGLLDRISGITGQGYQQAYDKAADLFGQERDYGLRALGAQGVGGQAQRDIAQQGIAANIAQFEEERDYPYKQLQFQQSLLQGMPVQQIQRDYIPQSDLAQALGIIGGVSQAGKDIKDFIDLFP